MPALGRRERRLPPDRRFARARPVGGPRTTTPAGRAGQEVVDGAAFGALNVDSPPRCHPDGGSLIVRESYTDRLESVDNLPRAGAVLRLDRHHRLNQGVEGVRHVRAEHPDAGPGGLRVQTEHLAEVALREGRTTGQAEDRGAPQRVDVRRDRHAKRLSGLLGGRVVGRSQDRSGSGGRFVHAGDQGQSAVEDLGRFVRLGQQEVVRLDVPVDDAP